jgi:hypothetical protein
MSEANLDVHAELAQWERKVRCRREEAEGQHATQRIFCVTSTRHRTRKFR